MSVAALPQGFACWTCGTASGNPAHGEFDKFVIKSLSKALIVFSYPSLRTATFFPLILKLNVWILVMQRTRRYQFIASEEWPPRRPVCPLLRKPAFRVRAATPASLQLQDSRLRVLCITLKSDLTAIFHQENVNQNALKQRK